MKEYIITDDFLDDLTMKFASAQGQLKELIRCENCKYDRECAHMMVRKSASGGNIYCPVTHCSEARRKEE